MARMRRSTSATSVSEAPDFNTMIMTVLSSLPGGQKQKAAGSSPRPEGIGAAGFVCPRLLGTSGQSRWADSGEKVKVREARRSAAHSVSGTLRFSRRRCQALSPRLVSVVAALAMEAADDALAIVVEGQADRRDQRDEDHRVDVLLLAHVGAKVRADPSAGQPPDRGHHGEHPERHRA